MKSTWGLGLFIVGFLKMIEPGLGQLFGKMALGDYLNLTFLEESAITSSLSSLITRSKSS